MRSTSSSVTDSGRRKRGICDAHHAAALGVAVEQHAVIAERDEVARDGQRGRAGADQRDALAVLLCRCLRQIAADVALVVGGDALQPADRDGLRLDPAAAAGRLAGPVAGAPQNPGEDVGFPVDRPGLAESAGGDQADVFRHRRVRRAGPLAIDNLVEVVWITDVGRVQYASPAGRLDVRTRTTPATLPLAVPKPGRGPCCRTSRSRPRLIPGLAASVIPLYATDCRRSGLRLRQLASSIPWAQSHQRPGCEAMHDAYVTYLGMRRHRVEVFATVLFPDADAVDRRSSTVERGCREMAEPYRDKAQRHRAL